MNAIMLLAGRSNIYRAPFLAEPVTTTQFVFSP